MRDDGTTEQQIAREIIHTSLYVPQIPALRQQQTFLLHGKNYTQGLECVIPYVKFSLGIFLYMALHCWHDSRNALHSAVLSLSVHRRLSVGFAFAVSNSSHFLLLISLFPSSFLFSLIK